MAQVWTSGLLLKIATTEGYCLSLGLTDGEFGEALRCGPFEYHHIGGAVIDILLPVRDNCLLAEFAIFIWLNEDRRIQWSTGGIGIEGERKEIIPLYKLRVPINNGGINAGLIETIDLRGKIL